MKHLHRKDYHDHLFMLEENNEELITYAQWCEMQNIRHKRRLPMGEETDKSAENDYFIAMLYRLYVCSYTYHVYETATTVKNNGCTYRLKRYTM